MRKAHLKVRVQSLIYTGSVSFYNSKWSKRKISNSMTIAIQILKKNTRTKWTMSKKLLGLRVGLECVGLCQGLGSREKP